MDQNPLEWPPKDVMEPPTQGENSEAAREWIRSVQMWIEQNSTSGERKHSEESVHNDSFMDLDQDSQG